MEWPERGASALPPVDLGIRIAYALDGRDLDLVAENERGRAVLSRLVQTG